MKNIFWRVSHVVPMAKSFAYRNWDGALPQSDLGDVLAINEANYGG